MSSRRLVWLTLALTSCGGTPAAEQRTAASLRGFYYDDDAGLSVTTGTVSVERPIGNATVLEAAGVVERIHVGAPESADGLGPVGHEHHGGASTPSTEVDVVSSASTTARVAGDSTLVRYEGQGRVVWGAGTHENPADVGVEARYSTEPDYRSFGATLTGRLDLFERNLTLGAFLSVGRDTVSPSTPVPGQANEWPASHDRVYLGTSLSQVLGPETILIGTFTLGRQAGALENPYRRVLVRTSLFPERVPDVRWRFTGSLGLARYLGDGFATHLRSGMYGDSWGVGAWIPEAAITKEFGQRVLADVHARWYSQTGATFFEHHYEDLAEHMTADIRLSSLTERAVGTYAAVVLLPASEPAGALSLNLSYERSWLDYREHDRAVTGDLLQAGIEWAP